MARNGALLLCVALLAPWCAATAHPHPVANWFVDVVTTIAGGSGAAYSVAFSPDGAVLAWGTDGNGVVLWDVVSSVPMDDSLYTVVGVGHPYTPVHSVCFSPDGAHLVLDDLLFDRTSGQREWLASDGYAQCAAFSPDGMFLALGDAGGPVLLFDLSPAKRSAPMTGPGKEPVQPDLYPAATLDGHTTDVTSLAFSPLNGLLVSGAWDGTVKVWQIGLDPTDWTLYRNFIFQDCATSVAFSPDGTLVAAGSDVLVQVWNVQSGVLLSSFSPFSAPNSGPSAVAFCPTDASLLAVGTENGNAQVWSLASQLPTLVDFTSCQGAAVNSVAFSPDGKILAVGCEDGTVRLWFWTLGPDDFLAEPVTDQS